MRLSNIEKAILEVVIKKGGASLKELPRELGIESKEVKEAIDLLIIKGLIREVVLGRDCSLECKSCPLSTLCPRVKGLNIKLYIPTDKAFKMYRALLK